jgi:hypothetical protein
MLKKLFVIEIVGVSLASLFEEQLAYVSGLMQVGCFGEFEATADDIHVILLAVRERLAVMGKQSFSIDSRLPQAQSKREGTADANAFSATSDILKNKEWDFVHVREHPTGTPTALNSLDGGLGQLLECLYDDSAILILTNFDRRAGFILAVPNNSVQGEVKDVRLGDILSTLSDLTALDIADWMKGASLVKISSPREDPARGYSQEDEKAVYARLEGLGYVD